MLKLRSLSYLPRAGLALVLTLALAGCPGETGGNNLCGNTVIDPGEECDDGNTIPGDGCDTNCTFENFCGNGINEIGEECDDGNFDIGDGCDNNCQVENGCGNGILEVGEQCDDDNLQPADGCSPQCTDEDGLPTCGNGSWEVGEGCDDGNTDPGDGCDASCLREDGCGNGTLEGAEQCDDGNNISGDGCSYQCNTEFFCGDATCDTANTESCEVCPQDCCPNCGNGVLDTADFETCDDGNNTAGDGCSAGCSDEDGVATCGNAIWEAGEGCDDGNVDPGDGCDASCQPEFVCGDGACDSGNFETCLLCPQDCCPECGNNLISTGEQCDSAELQGRTCQDFCFDGGVLGCTAGCTYDLSGCTGNGASCGDGVAECTEQCDDTDLGGQSCQTAGFSSGTLACDVNCGFDYSGCVDRLHYLQEDFEGGAPGWVASNIWEIGTPVNVGPAVCHGGTNCAGTKIDGNYAGNATYFTDTLDTPVVDLTGATDPRLRFYGWFHSQVDFDGGNIWISEDDGLSFQPVADTAVDPPYNTPQLVGVPAYSGDFSGLDWRPVLVDLSAYVGRRIVIRFAWASDSFANDQPGWYIDDVIIAEAADLPVEITTTTLPPGVNTIPYAATVQAVGGTGVYDFTIEAGGTNDAWLSIDQLTGDLSGTPDASNIGPVQLIVRVTDTTNASNFDERIYDFNVLDPIYFIDFEGGPPADFDFGGPGFWDVGTPGAGPATAHGGTQCMATAVAGNYTSLFCVLLPCSVSSGNIDLTTATAPILTFWQWVNNAPGDGGYLSVSVGGGGFTEVTGINPPYNGMTMGAPPLILPKPAYTGDLSGQGWHLVTLDLTPYTGNMIQLQWSFEGQGVGTHPGWYIDDIMVAD